MRILNTLQKFVLAFLALSNMFSCSDPKSVPERGQPDPVSQVYPMLDAANSRWFFFASACRPFGMVTLNPDTQVGGAWGSGYRYETDTIKGFSHIHGWQIAGVSVMPVAFMEEPEALLTDCYSQFDHEDEIAEVGYHKVKLNRYDITAELTSTTRVGFHQYTFPKDARSGVVFQLSGKLGPSDMKDGKLEMVDNRTLQGQITNAPTIRRPKDFIVYYTVIVDQDLDKIINERGESAMVTFKEAPDKVKMKVGISYTSHENATQNITEELPGWDFQSVVADSKSEWNQLLGRISISSTDSIQKRRFYTDLWHALQGRRIISDANGAYPDNTQADFRIGQIPLDQSGKPKFNHYNSDSFWGAQWTINTLWGLVYPEVYREFVNSLMLCYQDGGLVPRGPSGGNYTYVMTGASATPFIVSVFQKGIMDEDSEMVYAALKKNHLENGIMSKAGYEHNTLFGGGLKHYMEKGYVPYPIPEGNFGFHQDGASLTMEYAYQDWTLAQMARALGKDADYQYFLERSQNYRHVFDPQTGWMRPKDINGTWKEPFDPYQYENGFNESNGVQSTWFVGHDIPGLAALMGGKEQAVEKLNAQFEEASKLNFTSGNSHERGEDPNRARIAINYGNQPSIQTAFIFNQLDRPDLTQYWSSEVAKRPFGGLSPFTGYNGDEDQGLMGSLAVLLKLGLFQMNGGTEADPIYEFGSPMFDQVDIQFTNGKALSIRKEGQGVYVDQITFNGKKLDQLGLRHGQVTGGGTLIFSMKKQ